MTTVNLVWLVHRDLDQVLEIDRLSFATYLSEDDLRGTLRNRNFMGIVAVDDRLDILGYSIQSLHRHFYVLHRIAVHPDHRRGKVGAQLVDRIVKNLSSHGRKSIVTAVMEKNLEAQLFFRSLGFHCQKIVDGIEDSYYVFTKTADGCEFCIEDGWVEDLSQFANG